MTEFTKGPWNIEQYGDFDKVIRIIEPEVRVDNDDVDPDEAAANARLIAAAPEMFEDGTFLIERLLSFEQSIYSECDDTVDDWYGHVVPAIRRFKAALSKASCLQTEEDGE